MNWKLTPDNVLDCHVAESVSTFGARDLRRLKTSAHYIDEALKQLEPIANQQSRDPEDSMARYARAHIIEARHVIGEMRRAARPKAHTTLRTRTEDELIVIFNEEHPDGSTTDCVEFVRDQLKRVKEYVPAVGDSHSRRHWDRRIVRQLRTLRRK